MHCIINMIIEEKYLIFPDESSFEKLSGIFVSCIVWILMLAGKNTEAEQTPINYLHQQV